MNRTWNCRCGWVANEGNSCGWCGYPRPVRKPEAPPKTPAGRAALNTEQGERSDER